MKMTLERITPKKAAEYLAMNHSNRPYSQKHADKLAQAIIDGEWIVNGESIKLNGNGLIDGQHRMGAVIKAGKAIDTYVGRDLPSEAYDTIDQGRSRSLGDVLAREGRSHYTMLASVVRWIKAIQDGVTLGIVCLNTNASLHSYFKSIEEGCQKSCNYIRALREDMSFNGGVFGALHFLFSEKNQKLADEFFLKVCRGENITKSMPEYKLRKIMLDQEKKARKLDAESMCILTIKAWNAIRSKKELKLLRIAAGENRPQII